MNSSPILTLRFSQLEVTDLRVMFAARVSPVVKRMIAAEARARGRSEGELIDDLVLAACRCPDAVKILREYARVHPLVVAFSEVQRMQAALNESPPPKRKPDKP